MKNIYSLFVLSAAFCVNAQTTVLTEDFSSITTGDNITTGGSGVSWTGNTNFPTVSKAFSAGGAVRIGASGGAGSITSKAIDLSTDGGNVSISFDVKGWTIVETPITVTITGQPSQITTYTTTISSISFETKNITFTGGVANSKVIFATTKGRAFLDNIKITTTPTLGTIDTSKTKVSLVKNTSFNSNLTFGANSNVQIINASGQVVKSATVVNGTSVDVSSLPMGIYVVTGEVNGQKVSQKVIKK